MKPSLGRDSSEDMCVLQHQQGNRAEDATTAGSSLFLAYRGLARTTATSCEDYEVPSKNPKQSQIDIMLKNVCVFIISTTTVRVVHNITVSLSTVDAGSGREVAVICHGNGVFTPES